MSQLKTIPRPEKLTVARSLHENLLARQSSGPAEPGLDAYIPLLASLISGLSSHVEGKTAASAEHQTLLARAEAADGKVDTLYRHIDSYLAVEGSVQRGELSLGAKALRAAASPDGMALVNARVPEENAYCRRMLETLRNPVNAGILAGIEMPMAWLDRLEEALDESEAAQKELDGVRFDKRKHVGLGRNVEEEWVDVVGRLRSYMDNRAGRYEAVRQTEGEELMDPLDKVLRRMRAEAAARKTRRDKEEKPPAGEPTTPGKTVDAPRA
ncbi:hypothetical protein [Chondromyces apiculatus]|uniref:Uncharacterized protein n=1 Tax=Chondromyces apiculatus DSM 436 TaxID=1192034 RepID=A0A017TD52_9BACT|nr:hypothetical protein [Chondromyces apiculatus]EYF07218.1 Hypothetical protein CAP_0697 [Chondromyces apiculatus DSM 436]